MRSRNVLFAVVTSLALVLGLCSISVASGPGSRFEPKDTPFSFAGPLTPDPLYVGSATTESHPLWSATRLQFGIGVGRAFYSGDGAPDGEWIGGLYGSYNLVPWLDAVGRFERGFDAHTYATVLGLRAVVWRGVK